MNRQVTTKKILEAIVEEFHRQWLEGREHDVYADFTYPEATVLDGRFDLTRLADEIYEKIDF